MNEFQDSCVGNCTPLYAGFPEDVISALKRVGDLSVFYV